MQGYSATEHANPAPATDDTFFCPVLLEYFLVLRRITFVSNAGAILPGHQLYMLFVSALHAGRERILDAGRNHESHPRTAEGAFPSWDDQGIC